MSTAPPTFIDYIGAGIRKRLYLFRAFRPGASLILVMCLLLVIAVVPARIVHIVLMPLHVLLCPPLLTDLFSRFLRTWRVQTLPAAAGDALLGVARALAECSAR